MELDSGISVAGWEEQCPVVLGGMLLQCSSRSRKARVTLMCDFFWEDISKHLFTQDTELIEDQRNTPPKSYLLNK